jgi:hypothetical protein
MRWKISPDLNSKIKSWSHDPRAIDLLAIIALLLFVVGSGFYLADSFATPPNTTAFIVPSQSVRW